MARRKTRPGVQQELVYKAADIAGGGGGDAFEAAVLGEGSLYGFWTCEGLGVGGLSTGNQAMTDQSGNGRPDIQVVLSAPNNWIIDNTSPPGALVSLAQYVETTAGNQGITNYAALASAIVAPVAGGADFSGFVLFYTPSLPTNNQQTDIMTAFGTTAAPNGAGAVGAAVEFVDNKFPFGQMLGNAYADAGTNWSKFAMLAPPAAGQWWFYGFRMVSPTSYFYVQPLGVAWGAGQVAGTGNPGNPAIDYILRTGLRFGYGTSGGAAPLVQRWGPIAWFAADIGAAGLQTIYEAIA